MQNLKHITRAEFNERRYNRERFEQLSKAALFRVELVLEFVGHKKKVLDIACCDGKIGELLLRNGNEVCGIDISESTLKAARDKGLSAYKVDLECEEFPFPDNYFDVVFAGEIIEHIFDTDWFLVRIKRILKPKGSLILTTPNLATLGRRLLLMLGKNPLLEVSIEGDAAGHIRYFVKKTLESLLKKHDFEINGHTSDVVNFNKSGRFYSTKLARIFPSIGRTIIVKAENMKE